MAQKAEHGLRRLQKPGNHAGISYRIEGSGPALLLLPFFHAPSQWTPAIPLLARHFTVVSLGGRHLGGIAALEDRVRALTYRAMFRTLIDTIAPRPGARRSSMSGAVPARSTDCRRTVLAAPIRSPRST